MRSARILLNQPSFSLQTSDRCDDNLFTLQSQIKPGTTSHPKWSSKVRRPPHIRSIQQKFLWVYFPSFLMLSSFSTAIIFWNMVQRFCVHLYRFHDLCRSWKMHVGSVSLHVLPFLPDDLQKPGSEAINAASACDGKPPNSKTSPVFSGCIFGETNRIFHPGQLRSYQQTDFSVSSEERPPIPEDPNSTPMFFICLHHAKIIAK